MDTVLHRARSVSSGPVREQQARGARFVAVGALGTALYYLALIVLVEYLGMPVIGATCLAFALVVAVNYVLHRMWTFRSPVAHRRALLPFAMMSVAGFGINMAVMALGVAAGIHYLLVQAAAIGLVVTWNYIFTTRIFGRPGLPAPGSSKGFSDGPP